MAQSRKRASRSTASADPPRKRSAVPEVTPDLPIGNGATPVVNAPAVIGRTKRKTRSKATNDLRRGVLEMPEKSPAPAPRARSPAAAKRLSKHELALQVDRQKVLDTLQEADRKADMKKRWRAVGNTILDAARRQCSTPKEVQKFARRHLKSGAFKLKEDLNILFPKEAFEYTFGEKMVETITKEVDGDKEKRELRVFSPSIKRRGTGPPHAPSTDADKPGFCSFKQATWRKWSRGDKQEPKPSKEDLESAWEVLDEEERAPYEKAEEQAQQRYQARLTAYEKKQAEEGAEEAEEEEEVVEEEEEEEEEEDEGEEEEEETQSEGPHVGVSTRDAVVMRRLLSMPEAWRAFEYVSVCGREAQNATVRKLDLHYDRTSQMLNIKCRLAYT